MTLNRKVFALVLLGVIAGSLAMIPRGVLHSAGYFSQPGAWAFVMKPVIALAICAVAVVWISRLRGEGWDRVLQIALLFGAAGGALEVVNIVIENGVLFAVRGPSVQISSMLILFTSWGVAGIVAARATKAIHFGVIGAVVAAEICMVVAVAAGFAVEFLLRPPDPAYVATWGEFLRSGWTDARAFGVANTLDSAFTHLTVAPVIAALFGLAGSVLGRAKSSESP